MIQKSKKPGRGVRKAEKEARERECRPGKKIPHGVGGSGLCARVKVHLVCIMPGLETVAVGGAQPQELRAW